MNAVESGLLGLGFGVLMALHPDCAVAPALGNVMLCAGGFFGVCCWLATNKNL